ncbi:hypothetical protein HRbin02_01569 [Candidatus Calditenuaceae archaeon HR02]|nr:hypothetical protein HRbin02_01569 [Candidatus Calditenuaceae archaeon HR02]
MSARETHFGGAGHVWASRYRSGAVANAFVSILWTLLYVLPFEPFPVLLKIVVAGGPGVWFMLGYLLYIIVGFGGFLGLSYLYSIAEAAGAKRVNNFLALTGYAALFIGFTGTTIGLAVAGAVGGYTAVILHAPAENVRMVMEPFVNPLRILCLVTVIGTIASLAAPYTPSPRPASTT